MLLVREGAISLLVVRLCVHTKPSCFVCVPEAIVWLLVSTWSVVERVVCGSAQQCVYLDHMCLRLSLATHVQFCTNYYSHACSISMSVTVASSYSAPLETNVFMSPQRSISVVVGISSVYV